MLNRMLCSLMLNVFIIVPQELSSLGVSRLPGSPVVNWGLFPVLGSSTLKPPAPVERS